VCCLYRAGLCVLAVAVKPFFMALAPSKFYEPVEAGLWSSRCFLSLFNSLLLRLIVFLEPLSSSADSVSTSEAAPCSVLLPDVLLIDLIPLLFSPTRFFFFCLRVGEDSNCCCGDGCWMSASCAFLPLLEPERCCIGWASAYFAGSP